jgi:type VII secretion-associated serine protease mycosin
VRKLMRGVAAIALVALTALPAGPADAAALPKPRLQEWWFSFWDIENKVWPITQGQGVTVAVVDTGVNASLPGLQGVVQPGLNARRNGTGDGRTDTDKNGHGTAMAEMIAGQGQDDGMVGVAPGAKIIPITADDSPDTLASSIRYAVDHGAQVINISLGSADDPGPTCVTYASVLQEAVAYAAEKNVVIVAAAGNSGNTTNTPISPANCAGVLAVGAIDGKKLAWTHSEHQPYVAVAAPGLGTGSVDKNGRYIRTSGTSDAAALTSGAVALIRSKYPSMPARDVVQKIINTTVEAGPPGHDDYTGSGAVVPIWALTKDVDKAAPNPPYERLDKWLASHGKKSGSAPSQSSQPGKPAAGKKSSSGSGLVVALVVVAILAVVAAVIVIVLLARRRRGGSRPVVQEQQPFPGGPGLFPPSLGAHDGYQDPGGNPRVGRPQGPPPSFRPPEDRSGPQN